MQAEAPRQEERWEIVGRMAKERYRAEEIAEQVGIARSLVYKDKKRYEEETGEALPKPVQKTRFRDPYAEQWEAEQAAKQEAETPAADYEQRFQKLLKKYEAICKDYEQVENERDEWKAKTEQTQPDDDQRKNQKEMELAQEHIKQLKAKVKNLQESRNSWSDAYNEKHEEHAALSKETRRLRQELKEANQANKPGEDYKAKYDAVVQALKAHL